MTAEATPACSGLRIIDLSRVLAGPYCTAILADLGATVIRVEHPVHADETRVWQPVVDGMSAAFAAVNHTKRSICVDVWTDEGRQILVDLLRTADVLVENFRPGTLERLRLDAKTLEEINPRLIHCAISAFPSGTAMAHLPGYEATIQAHSGIMDLTGEADGPAVRCGPSVVDLSTGMASAIGILAALRQRDITGKGLRIEPSLLRSATNLMNFQISSLTVSGAALRRYGSGHISLVPYGSFETRTGPVLLAASNDQLWKRLWNVIAPGETLPYPRLSERVDARADVNELVAQRTSAFDRDALLALLEAQGVPAAAVQTLTELLSDATLESAGVVSALPLTDNRETMLAGPLVGGDIAVAKRAPAPRSGQHTELILAELGMDGQDIAELRRRKIVFAGPASNRHPAGNPMPDRDQAETVTT